MLKITCLASGHVFLKNVWYVLIQLLLSRITISVESREENPLLVSFTSAISLTTAFWPNECSYWWRITGLLPVCCDFCLRDWICEILLLEWNHVLFMRYVIWFKELQNTMWFVPYRLCVLMLHTYWLPLSLVAFLLRVFRWHNSATYWYLSGKKTGTMGYRRCTSCSLTVWLWVQQLEFSIKPHVWQRKPHFGQICSSVVVLCVMFMFDIGSSPQ